MLQQKKRMAGYILMAIFVFYYASICFFYHCHIINGVTVVHSHIYGGEHTQNDIHGESEITLIAALSSFQSSQPAMNAACPDIFLFLNSVIEVVSAKETFAVPAVYHCLRAPPET